MGKVGACYASKLEVVWYTQEYRSRTTRRKFDVYETNVRWRSGEKEKPEGISKKNMHFVVISCYEYIEKWICGIDGDDAVWRQQVYKETLYPVASAESFVDWWGILWPYTISS
jgi:hypothetical protein